MSVTGMQLTLLRFDQLSVRKLVALAQRCQVSRWHKESVSWVRANIMHLAKVQRKRVVLTSSVLSKSS
jgi:hypothetical protein